MEDLLQLAPVECSLLLDPKTCSIRPPKATLQQQQIPWITWELEVVRIQSIKASHPPPHASEKSENVRLITLGLCGFLSSFFNVICFTFFVRVHMGKSSALEM